MAIIHGTRRSIRHHVRVPVTVLVGEGKTVIGLSSDFSEAGMALCVSERFEIGQLIRVEFTIPTLHQTIRVDASIRHSDDFRYGLEFRNLGTIDVILLSASSDRLSTLLLAAAGSRSVAVQA